jgi:hypothetical protein
MQEQSAGGHGLDTWKATAPTEHGQLESLDTWKTMHNHELHATFKVRGQVGISRGLDASHHMPNDDELGM